MATIHREHRYRKVQRCESDVDLVATAEYHGRLAESHYSNQLETRLVF